MSSRLLHCRNSILAVRSSVWLRNSPRALAFSTFTRRVAQVSTGHSSQGSNQRDEEQKSSGFRGPRPLTVFAVCIPLGYAVNWAVKEQYGSAQISRDGFVKYTLTKKEDVSSTCAIFTLQPVSPTCTLRRGTFDDGSVMRGIMSVEIKQPQLQIARNYTILPPCGERDPDHLDDLRFLIRKEHAGEVSGYLHGLPIGADVELRGPNMEYPQPIDVKFNNIVFLAGGTGIAPAMQLADSLAGEANVHILWANRKREDCLGGQNDKSAARGWSLSRWWQHESNAEHVREKGIMVIELEALQRKNQEQQGSLKVDYFVDEEGTFIEPKNVIRLLQQAAQAESRSLRGDVGDKTPMDVIFVSGPPGFINYWAGAKQWLSGREVQGPLGGILAGMDLRGWEVVNL